MKAKLKIYNTKKKKGFGFRFPGEKHDFYIIEGWRIDNGEKLMEWFLHLENKPWFSKDLWYELMHGIHALGLIKPDRDA